MLGAVKDFFSKNHTFKRIVSNPYLYFEGKTICKQLDTNIFQRKEQGSYLLSGQIQEFYQEYIFKWEDGRLFIFKKDNTLLHLLDFSACKNFPIITEHKHFCKDDVYHIHLTIENEKIFKTLYTIKGPQKNYQIFTQYT